MTSISDTEVVNAPGGLVELGFGTSYGTTVTATSLSSSNTIIISDVTVICDGSPVIIDFSTPITTPAAIAGAFIQMALYRDGSTFLGFAPASVVPSAATDQKPASFQFRDTPTAGVHTYRVVAYRDGGAGTASIGGSSAAGWMPNILRVSKIIQASQLLVPLASAPLVTSLPSAPIDGQEIRYVADATNGIIWNLRYRAASSSSYKWEFVGGSSLRSTGAGGTTNSATPQTANTPSITVPLAGDYDCTYGGFTQNTIYNVVHNASIGLYKDSTGLETLIFVPVGTYNGGNIAGLYRATGINASQIFNLRYWVSGSTAVFGSMYIHISPIRVG